MKKYLCLVGFGCLSLVGVPDLAEEAGSGNTVTMIQSGLRLLPGMITCCGECVDAAARTCRKCYHSFMNTEEKEKRQLLINTIKAQQKSIAQAKTELEKWVGDVRLYLRSEHRC